MDTDSRPRLHVYSLPNEVFVQILSPFSTRELLPLTAVSHRFHALVLRILHYRLLVAASLKEYKLILECFQPSSKLVEPHVFCRYLGTDGLSDRHEGEGSLYENVETAQRLAILSALYSRFRPERPTDEENAQRPPLEAPRNGTPSPSSGPTPVVLAGVVGFLRRDVVRRGTAEAANNAGTRREAEEQKRAVTRIVNLEEFEDFSQLCVVTNIVKVVPGSNLLLSAVTVEDGILRLFRDWLKRNAKPNDSDLAQRSSSVDEEKDARVHYSSKLTEDSITTHASPVSNSSTEQSMLWVDEGRNVGLKLSVKEKRWNRSLPVLVHRDELETSVSYEVEIQELHIRTTRLLMTVERSLQEQRNYKNALIFGAYPKRTNSTH